MNLAELRKSTIVNLTPHNIVFRCEDEAIGDLVFPASGKVARVTTTAKAVGEVLSIIEYGEIEGLPKPTAGILYLVSGMLLSHTKRLDVLAPDTSESAIRDSNGHIQAVTKFLCCQPNYTTIRRRSS